MFTTVLFFVFVSRHLLTLDGKFVHFIACMRISAIGQAVVRCLAYKIYKFTSLLRFRSFS